MKTARKTLALDRELPNKGSPQNKERKTKEGAFRELLVAS